MKAQNVAITALNAFLIKKHSSFIYLRVDQQCAIVYETFLLCHWQISQSICLSQFFFWQVYFFIEMKAQNVAITALNAVLVKKHSSFIYLRVDQQCAIVYETFLLFHRQISQNIRPSQLFFWQVYFYSNESLECCNIYTRVSFRLFSPFVSQQCPIVYKTFFLCHYCSGQISQIVCSW